MRRVLQVGSAISALIWLGFSSNQAAAQPSGFRFGVHGASRPGISRSQDGASMRTLYSTGAGSGGRSGFYQGSSVHDKVMRSLDRFSVKLAAKSAEAASEKEKDRRKPLGIRGSESERSPVSQPSPGPQLSPGARGSKKVSGNAKNSSPSWVQVIARGAKKNTNVYSQQRELSMAKRSVDERTPWWSNKRDDKASRKFTKKRRAQVIRDVRELKR